MNPTPKMMMVIAAAVCVIATAAHAVTINADFSRDIDSPNANPGGNPADVLYVGTGPAPDAGTFWNDVEIGLTGSGSEIVEPVLFSNLTASDGTTPTAIDVEFTSGWFRAFNGTASGNALQNDRVFPTGTDTAVATLKGLNPAATYDVYLIGAGTTGGGSVGINFTIGASTQLISGDNFDGSWTLGGEYAAFFGISPDLAGTIAFSVQDDAGTAGAGVLAGLQVVEHAAATVPAPAALPGALGLIGLLAVRRSRIR